MSVRSLTLVSLLATTAMVGACEFGDQGPPNPAPNELSGNTASSGTSSSSGGGTIKRTVETRNPFGDMVGNLMVDGDFELLGLFEGQSSQTGWLAFSENIGRRHIPLETGGLCKSGLRCAVLEPGALLYGDGTAARGTGMIASVWIKPPPGRDCTVANVGILRCNANTGGATLEPLSTEPDAQGWCFYRGERSESQSAYCMFIESTLTGDERAIVDAASLLPDDGTAPRRFSKKLSSSRQERYRKIARKVRDMRPLGGPPPQDSPIGDL